MLIICRILNIILNPLIVIAAVLELALLVYNCAHATALRRRVDGLNRTTVKKTTRVEKGEAKQYRTTYATTISRDWNAFDELCDDYQKQNVFFSAYSMAIQIFPLLGILGTVAGLYIALNSNQDWSSSMSLYEGVRFALSATVLGLIAAILFKVADVGVGSFFLNYIDDGIDRFRNNYREEKDISAGGSA